MSSLETWPRRELLTAVQMRALEQTAIGRGAVTGLELMERAGRGVVSAVFAEWPDLAAAPRHAVVLCGPGNNGGDGFVIARLLKGWGWRVDVFLYGDPEKLPPDARTNHDRWLEMGTVRLLGFPDTTRDDAIAITAATGTFDERGGPCDLIVDAIFGTGLTRPPDGLAHLFDSEECDTWGGPETRRVAVDVPSGLCADSGRRFPEGPRQMTPLTVFPADLTVTFGCAKPGHYLGEGPRFCGRLVLDRIGLPDPALDLGAEHEIYAGGAGPAMLAGGPGRSARKAGGGHKYAHGHALILSGPFGRSGAARLAARAALRVGAGLVTVGAPGDAMAECAAQLTAIMLRQVDGAEALAGLLGDRRINAVCLGPGMGVGQGTRDMVAAALAATDPGDAAFSGRGVVLDADGLTSWAEAPDELFARLHAGCVLTPHMGEFARLFPDLAERVEDAPARGPIYSKLDAARAASDRAGCAVLLKGMDTVIAAPGSFARINTAAYDRAAPWLATAGSGDVLAGLIAGLMARGMRAAWSAEYGAWLHVEAARRFGPGLIAEDLPETLPGVLRDVPGEEA